MHSILIRGWNLKAIKYRVETTTVLTDTESVEMGAGEWMGSEGRVSASQGRWRRMVVGNRKAAPVTSTCDCFAFPEPFPSSGFPNRTVQVDLSPLLTWRSSEGSGGTNVTQGRSIRVVLGIDTKTVKPRC